MPTPPYRTKHDSENVHPLTGWTIQSQAAHQRLDEQVPGQTVSSSVLPNRTYLRSLNYFTDYYFNAAPTKS